MKKALLLSVVCFMLVSCVAFAFDTSPMQVSIIKDDVVSTLTGMFTVALMAVVTALIGVGTSYIKSKWGIEISNDMTDIVERYATVGITTAERIASNAIKQGKDKLDSDAKMRFAMKIGWSLLRKSKVKNVSEEDFKNTIESLLHRGIIEKIAKSKESPN